MGKPSTCARVVRQSNTRSGNIPEENPSQQGFGNGPSGIDQPGSLVGCPEAIACGLSREDSAALDVALYGLAGIQRLTQTEREAVADVLFGFLLDFGGVDIADGAMAAIRRRAAS